MVGSTGPRVLAAASDAEWWNCWYSQYGNTPEGFAQLAARVGGDFKRSACVLVTVDGGAGERPHDPEAPPVDASALREHLRALDAAGADEAILVLDPIDEHSVTRVADVLG